MNLAQYLTAVPYPVTGGREVKLCLDSYDDPTEVQTCTGCGETKLMKHFHFDSVKMIYRADCKVCANKKSRIFALERKLAKLRQ